MKEKHKWTFEQISKHFKIGIRTIFRWDKKIEAKARIKEQKTKIKKEGRKLIYIDESGFEQKSPRTNGYSINFYR